MIRWVWVSVFEFLIKGFWQAKRVRPKASVGERWSSRGPREGLSTGLSCGQEACPRRTRLWVMGSQ